MSDNIKVCESEFSTNINKISNYCKFISDEADKYMQTLFDIYGASLRDILIINQISDINTQLDSIVSEMNNVEENLKRATKEFQNSMENVDKFKYDDSAFAGIRTLFSNFF